MGDKGEEVKSSEIRESKEGLWLQSDSKKGEVKRRMG